MSLSITPPLVSHFLSLSLSPPTKTKAKGRKERKRGLKFQKDKPNHLS